MSPRARARAAQVAGLALFPVVYAAVVLVLVCAAVVVALADAREDFTSRE